MGRETGLKVKIVPTSKPKLTDQELNELFVEQFGVSLADNQDDVLVLPAPALLSTMYYPRALVESFIPKTNDGRDSFVRKYQNVSVRLECTGGLPWGTTARKLLLYAITAAKDANSRTIDLPSENVLLRELGIKSGRDRSRYKEQIRRLLRTRIEIEYKPKRGSHTQFQGYIFSQFHLEDEDGAQLPLFRSSVTLGTDFYNSVVLNKRIRFDGARIRQLHSATAIDLFLWLSLRLHKIPVGDYVVLTPEMLAQQFGDETVRHADLVRSLRSGLEAVVKVVPEWKNCVRLKRHRSKKQSGVLGTHLYLQTAPKLTFEENKNPAKLKPWNPRNKNVLNW